MTSDSSAPKPPRGLGPRGRAVWRACHDGFVFEPDRLAVLEEFCVAFDELKRLQQVMADEPVVTRGSRNQPISHPLLAEIRLHRLMLAKLSSALHIPEDPDAPPVQKPRKATGRVPSFGAVRSVRGA